MNQPTKNKVQQLVYSVLFSLFAFSAAWSQCIAPTNVTVGTVLATSAEISWDATTSPAGLEYFYEVRTSGAPGSNVDPLDGYVFSGNTANNLLTTTIIDLEINTTYFFYIKYRCSLTLDSPWTTAVSFTTTSVQPPVATPAIYISNISFLSRWLKSDGATGYRLDVSTQSDFSTFVPGFEDVFVPVRSKVVTGLSPNTTYYYRVRAVGAGPVTSGNSNVITVTTISAALSFVVWTEAGWSGDPLLEVDAIIDFDFNTLTDFDFECKSLTINPGNSLVIDDGTYVIVDNEIINNAGDTGIIVRNNGSLVQLNNSGPANIGTISVERNSSALFRLDYTMWSSPLSGGSPTAQTLKQFSPQTVDNRFYVYNTTNDIFSAVSPQSTFTEGQGYLIRMANNHVPFVDNSSTPAIWSGTFKGIPNNGEITVPLSQGGQGYNLVGNPYPSVISVEDLFNLNQDNIEGTIYFWRRRNSALPGNTSSYYATYTNLGGTTPSDSSEEPNGFIQVGQGFLVQANTTATSPELVFSNDLRVSDNFENQFFRTQNQIVEKHRIWLNLTNENGVFSQMLLGYMEGATISYDRRIDGKHLNEGTDFLTSLIDNEKYTIQGRPLPFSNQDVVPLELKVANAGTYTISLSKFDGLFDTNQPIFLKDNMSNSIHNLKESNYSFVTEAGSFASRFEIVYQNTILSTTEQSMLSNNLVVFEKNNALQFESTQEIIKTIMIYDITGRLVFEKDNINENSFNATTLVKQNQVLIAKIVGQNNEEVIKKIIF